MQKRVSDSREAKDTETVVRPNKYNANELDIAVHSSNTKFPPDLSG